MKIVTFLRENADFPKWVVDFPRERDTFRNKIMEIVEDLASEDKTIEIFRDFAFFLFLHFSSFFNFSSMLSIFLHFSVLF